ncbi:MAG: hypothetical protein P4M00_16765 [Azospirillaceae bacterium]|nr:hypothetical protein [Azospirillaceae bacterium]
MTRGLVLGLSLVVAVSPTWAQESAAVVPVAPASAPATATPAADPPTRVGRIALLDGPASFHPAPTAEWSPAALNYPVAPSTALWTDAGGRAELEFGAARVRLDADTEVDVVQLDNQNIVIAVPQGRVDISLNGRPSDEHYRVETPRGDLDLVEDGDYRIIAGSAVEGTRDAVFRGRLALNLASGPLIVSSGSEATLSIDTPPRAVVAAAVPDGFDGWSDQRDRTLFARPVPVAVRAVPGAAALGDYGTWRTVPQYGQVWTPTTVSATWAPYHDGHWAWIDPWGWTWVDDAPWGFAPFHYGRWIRYEDRWSWIPVAPGVGVGVVVRPAYSPALVAWVGDPAPLIVGAAIGAAVAWIALGPNEPWHPSYPCSPNYLRSVNQVNVSRNVINNITVINDNRRFTNVNYATVVPRDTFAGARPVAAAALAAHPGSGVAVGRVAMADPARVNLPAPVGAAHVGGPAAGARVPPAAALTMAHPAAASAAAFQAHQGHEPGGAPAAGQNPAAAAGAAPEAGQARPGAAAVLEHPAAAAAAGAAVGAAAGVAASHVMSGGRGAVAPTPAHPAAVTPSAPAAAPGGAAAPRTTPASGPATRAAVVPTPAATHAAPAAGGAPAHVANRPAARNAGGNHPFSGAQAARPAGQPANHQAAPRQPAFHQPAARQPAAQRPAVHQPAVHQPSHAAPPASAGQKGGSHPDEHRRRLPGE